MEEIVIPNLEDDDDDFQLPLTKPSFGAGGSTSSLPETDPYAHRTNPSTDASTSYAPRLQATPTRPILPQASASFSVGVPTPNTKAHGFGQSSSSTSDDRSKLGKFSNGSSSSLVTPGTSIGSSSGFLQARKGSLASLKNAFKSSSSSNNQAIPPVPTLDTKAYGAPGYPALRNPFSRFDSPISPKHSTFKTPNSRSGKTPSTSTTASPAQHNITPSGGAVGYHNPDGRKYSIASSHRSQGGRSINSQGSSNFRAEDHPMPALPPIPMRQTPSRMNRMGSDASVFGFTSRRNGSIGGGGEDGWDGAFGKTPGEEALKVVFRDLREAANQKVGRICARPLNTQPSLPSFLDSGVDPTFDSLINSLAHCGTRHARRVVDLLMSWCRDYTGNIGASEVRAHLDRSLGLQMRVEDAAAILQSRKSSAAKFIMNRSLIELLKVIPKDSLDQELGMTLEQNAFNAYRSEKIEEIIQFPHRKAVAQLQVELLGQLSNNRFLTVSDRFIRELSKYTSTNQPTKENEARIEHLLKGMKHLKLRVYPEDELEMSSEFMTSLASFFANSHGQTLKIAYAETFTSLLHPVIETATAEVNHPMWSKAIAIILERALAMAQKARYWPAAFPLVITALGVSPREVFMQQWQSCMDAILAKFKDRNLRAIAMGAFVRVLWIYLNRCSESSTSMRKRLDPLVRTCFTPTGSLYPPELPSDPFIAILHFVMTRHLDYGEEFASEFLRNGAVDGMADRSTVLVRAINYTLRSIELEKSATWPTNPDFTKFEFEGFESSGETLPFDAESKPEVHDLLKRCGPAFVELLFQCDNNIKHLLLSNDAVALSGHASSHSMDNVSENICVKHGDVYVTYSARYAPTLHLMCALLESFPRCMPSDVNFPQLVNVLCRATFSGDPKVCSIAGDTLRRICQDPEKCSTVVNTFREFVFETRHVFRDTFIGARLLESQFERIISLWLDLLQVLVGHQRVAEAQAIDDETEKRAPPIEPSQISKIEGCALFLLCSTSLPIRRLANQILVAARNLEGQQRRPSAAFRYSRIVPDKIALTRVLQLLEYNVEESDLATIRGLPWMTSSDRHRIDLLCSKDRNKLLQRIAESDHPKDGLLWLSVLPFFIGKLVEQLPSPASDLRQVVCQLVLRLQAHVALVAGSGVSGTTRGTPSRGAVIARTSSDTAILADHWRAYLSVLCVTMSSKGPAPPTPPVHRTKDVVILNQEMINTPGLFSYLTSLLGWEDPRFKDAAVYAMGSIGQDLLRPLSEILLSVVRRLADGSKVGGTPRTDGGGNTSRRTPLTAHGPIWTSVAHVFRLISPLLLDAKSSSHLTNLSSMIGFVKVTYTLLSDRSVKEDFELQSLRRSFCITVENLTNSLGKLDSSDRFLGEEVRGSIFKICFEWCHVGRRPDVAKARESQTLQAAAEGYRGDRDRAQYLDDLQAKTKFLSAAAAEAMAGLCQGKLISANEATPAQQASDHMVEPLTVLRWIRGMFSSSSVSHHETGRRALFALIKYNWDCDRLLDEVLHQSFGEGEQFSLESSFFGVVADVLSEGHHTLPIEQIACLALSKLGHPVSAIRQRAFQLTESLYINPSSKLQSTALFPAIGSSSANIYQNAQKEMSVQLASIYADHAFPFLAECTTRLSQLEAPRRQATLSILRPWVEYLDLASDTSELSPEDAAAEHQALQNLVYLAVRFSDDHLEDVKSIFVSFADAGYAHQQSPPQSQSQSHNTNTTALMKFLFEQGGKRKSPEFVNHAQRIMACLAQSKAGDAIFEEICNFVEPNAMAALPEADIPPSPMTSLVNLDSLMNAPSSRSQTFSTGQLALLFAGELLPHRIDDISLGKRLPSLLHAALVHSDHNSSALRDQAQSVLFQTLRAWICDLSNVPTGDAASIWSSTENKLTSLARTASTAFWKADDNGTSESAFLAPPKMTGLIMKILGILLPLQPRIRQQWGELALSWATSCPIRHLACRSFQVFRILSPRVNPRMVSDTLARLSSTIASPSSEIQAFNQEVLRTFAAMVQNLSMSEAYSYPQIFWCSVACLTTPFENEFTEVIELLSQVLDKTNLSDPSVVGHLVSFRPPDWVGPAPYLQSLLLVGLRSSKTAFLTFDLIRRLTSASQDELIDSPNDRLLHGFIAALPWMLHSLEVGEPNEELASMALDLASIADTQGNASFSRLLTSFARVRFRAKDDFIRQASALLRDFMSSHALDIVTLLLGFILNTNDWMREKSMSILKLVLQYPEARVPIQQNGNELLVPLLRLVSTKHSSQALDVLDIPLPPSSMDNAGAMLSPNSFSKEGGGEIFGSINDETGWSVPKTKELSAMTKENVHAVFNTCAIETRAASAHFSVVQFTDLGMKNGFNGFGGLPNHSQMSFDLPSPPLSSIANHSHPNQPYGIGIGGKNIDNQSIGDLVGALHSLGQFFDDGLSIEGEDEGSPGITENHQVFGRMGMGMFGGAGAGLTQSRRGSDAKAPVMPYGQGHGHGKSGSDVSERRLRAIMARGHQASISSPIYETSPSHSTINGPNPNSSSSGNIPNYNRAFIHRPNMSISMTSDSSITSSLDGDNITQRLNFQGQGRDDSTTTGTGRHSRNNSNLNVFLNTRRGGGHGQMESVSSISDAGDAAFGLDEQNHNQSMVSINSFMNRQAIWEGTKPAHESGNSNGVNGINVMNGVIDLNEREGRSEQSTPVLARRNIR
ncbi:hypothetical protein I302_105300 [Kwoniella bestiolae CBS 10118]|uniref:Cell polarity protein mor2 n=1 Tax=Kwoniella bestiolae CBS 10118 TaxID=1296100 RepID=A0A1B9FSQ7_9TREE|nr:cell polarity protein mor2 [Kwoniella bestiolae CBS 10118]OCF21809.1 cell polarity protein mor2 [Kwoniella bestiolae CBS 10118]